MHLTYRNSNDAFVGLVGLMNGSHPIAAPVSRRSSRNGDVLVLDGPVTVTYTHPRERVLLNAARDWNPFLFLYHALWILAGRNDVAPLAYYAKQFREYSDDGRTLNGAYGYRWRTAEVSDESGLSQRSLAWHGRHGGIDQLDLLVTHLKANPDSRRAVLQMWNVEDDLLKIGGTRMVPDSTKDFGSYPTMKGCSPEPGSKDVCCNLSVLFSLRPAEFKHGYLDYDTGRVAVHQGYTHLDMTVVSRSEDLVWGLLGEDYLTFTVLLEYVAAQLGVEVGRYHHVANNLHAYVDRPDWKPQAWLEQRYEDGPRNPLPLVKDPVTFDREVVEIVERWSGQGVDMVQLPFHEPFLAWTAQPMFAAFRRHKAKDRDGAMTAARGVEDGGWRAAAVRWLERRYAAQVDKKSPTGEGRAPEE